MQKTGNVILNVPTTFLWIFSLFFLLGACQDQPGVDFETLRSTNFTAKHLDQLHNSDSLIKVVKTYKNSRQQIDSLLYWTEMLSNYNEVAALEYATEALQISTIYNKTLSRAISKYYQASLKQENTIYGENSENAIADARISYRLLENIDQPEWNIKVNNLLAVLYNKQQVFDSAKYYLQKSLQILDNNQLTGITHYNLKALTLHIFANLYAVTDSTYNQAHQYYNEALKLYVQSNNQKRILDLYTGLGLLYMRQGKYPLSDSLFKKSEALAVDLNEKNDLAKIYNHLGYLKLTQWQIDPSDYYFDQAMGYLEKGIPLQKENLSYSYNLRGFAYHRKWLRAGSREESLFLLDSAIVHYNYAVREATKEGGLDIMWPAMNNLFKICNERLEYSGQNCDELLGAERMLYIHQNYEKLLLSNKKDLNLASQIITKFEKREREAMNNRRIQILWLISGAVLIFAVLVFFLLLHRQQNKRLKAEKKVVVQLKKVDRIKDQFLANTSHELRTPLQGIIGLSESLLERERQPEKKEDLSMIVSSGMRLTTLVNDILDFSKLKNHDIQLSQKSLSLYAMIDVILKNNAPLVKDKNLALINAIPRDLPAVFADENRLQQILYNLIGNAIKFTEAGHVKVAAIKKGTFIQICVEDTGIGIPEEKKDLIFQEFEQGDGSISREFSGTGLGLSISKQLVELHGGQIWVGSKDDKATLDETLARGATLFFTIPIAKGQLMMPTTRVTPHYDPEIETTAKAHSSRNDLTPVINLDEEPVASQDSSSLHPAASPGKEQTSVRILVVDDEPINQQVFKNHLAGQGYHVTRAMNGKEAISLIQNNPSFDLILLDVMMPNMSGYEVCVKIREKYLPSELPIIMVTAKNQLQDIVQGLSIGANDYLPKPFHKDELLARITTQLDLHRIFEVAGKFVPNEFLRSLNKKRLTEVGLGDFIEREVTVLFLDIRGYTTLSESMTPEENFKFVNAFHGQMGPIILQHGGFVSQYLGDAIMAIFPQSPKEALSAAVNMQRELIQYNIKRSMQGHQPVHIGIGLHTGSLIMGIVGDSKRMDATTISDTVNTASRIENLTKHFGVQILLSKDSLQQIHTSKNLDSPSDREKEEFNVRYLGKVQVKGKKAAIGIYECFDGDLPEIIEKKYKTLDDFNQGLAYFLAQDFAKAVTAFDQVLKTNQTDQPAKLFLHKSNKFILEGGPQDWDGTEIMDSK